ncbi:MAG: hypothetical protein KF760_28000 [Candidatus Eremiobacteraeota bacterium]|nr:hypothetical protein [Candidatus Eremiobacteraeota bacterium]MCW5871487.1 hypothetical protein [Candidatus Eremiobacteraeota bacterium]
MAINPTGLTSVRTLSPLGAANKTRPSTTEEVPRDAVQLSRPSAGEPAETQQRASSNWLKRTLLGAGLTATAVAGGMTGLPAQAAASAHVKVVNKNAPTLLTSRVGVTPSRHDVGKLGKIETDRRLEARPGANGKQLTHEVRIDRLSRAGDGKVLYNSDDAELATLDFHDEGQANWKTSSIVQGAGHYGKFISISETTTRSTGGPETTEVKLRTIDSRTGKVVNLSELVSGGDYQKMADAIEAGLKNPAGQHYQQPDMESWDYHMNNGFSLREGKDGRVILTVAIPSDAPEDSGKVAEFSFALPAGALLLK